MENRARRTCASAKNPLLKYIIVYACNIRQYTSKGSFLSLDYLGAKDLYSFLLGPCGRGDIFPTTWALIKKKAVETPYFVYNPK